mmetsp:Transcript_37024/g.78712  ORF Transcript_37024/g.78712 Transcript_37024/m.78712 type:complete len:224 (-) Transcript_37024:605-1276(-)
MGRDALGVTTRGGLVVSRVATPPAGRCRCSLLRLSRSPSMRSRTSGRCPPSASCALAPPPDASASSHRCPSTSPSLLPASYRSCGLHRVLHPLRAWRLGSPAPASIAPPQRSAAASNTICPGRRRHPAWPSRAYPLPCPCPSGPCSRTNRGTDSVFSCGSCLRRRFHLRTHRRSCRPPSFAKRPCPCARSRRCRRPIAHAPCDAPARGPQTPWLRQRPSRYRG